MGGPAWRGCRRRVPDQLNRPHDPALVRYREDSAELLITHDDDPAYRAHALAARKVAKPGDKFILGKPSEHQKIDILMADVLAYEAAADARAAGWTDTPKRANEVICFTR